MEKREVTSGVFVIEASDKEMNKLMDGGLDELRKRCPDAFFILRNNADPAAYYYLRKFNFSIALQLLKSGVRVARHGWNGKGMWLTLVPGSTITVSEGRPLAKAFTIGTQVEYLPHIDMKTADNKVVPWLASQTDLLADDWEVVD